MEHTTWPDQAFPVASRRKHLKNPFRSFWMGGFECSDKINSLGNRVNLLEATDHIRLIREDYAMLHQTGICTVREGIRWSVVEPRPYYYDFSTVLMMMEAGREQGIQQVWDICHFGFPDDLSPLHPHFTRRFAALCRAFAQFFVAHFGYEELVITPINEVSFLSWLGGDEAGTVPFCKNEGWNVKYKLMQAYIEGIKCLKSINPSFRILATEPLVNIVPPENADGKLLREAAAVHISQFQVLDILTGNMCRELGGQADCIDVIGLNFYYNNQWVYKQPAFLPWANEHGDARWRSLSSLISEVYERYSYPLILAETSHPGRDRPLWIDYITRECTRVLAEKIPFWGICIYPVIDRPDWDDPDNWHHSGIWDYFPDKPGMGKRILHEPYAASLRQCQQRIGAVWDAFCREMPPG